MNAARILEIGTGFWASKILLTAVKLELFTVLASPTKARSIQSKLGISQRGIYDFLDCLVSMKLITREGFGEDAVYGNSADAARFLDKRKPEYMGGILEFLSDRAYRMWADFEEGLKSGQAQSELKGSGESVFEGLYRDPVRLESFMAAAAALNSPSFIALAKKFNFSNFRTVCDLGGASAAFSTIAAGVHTTVKFLSFDLPQVEAIAKKHIAFHGREEQVQTYNGDFFADPLPRSDVFVLSSILHDWNIEKKLHLIKSTYDALPNGGALIAIDNIIDDERRVNTFGLIMSLHMLMETGDGFDYTHREFDGWCKQAGFARSECIHLSGPLSAVIAYKDQSR